MNKRTIGLVLGVLVSVILIAVSYTLMTKPFRLPSADYRIGYRLVPEKISRSAAIAIALPAGTSAASLNPAEQVVFTPEIRGQWLKTPSQKVIPVAKAATIENELVYFQPDKPLEPNKHYSVALAISAGQSLQEDFLAVADPEIVSILPTGDDEVLTNTKISIIFNRPMVPLSALDQLSGANLPVTITPKTDGRYKWISTNTLKFIPTDGLISSTKYKVVVNSGFRSLEGLGIKPKESTFSTYKLRYLNNGSKLDPNAVVRGYNQPFLIHFNQPVDLEQTARQITIDQGSKGVPFILKYWQTDNSEVVAKSEGAKDSSLFAGLTNILPRFNTASVIASKDKTKEDQTTIAIYPENGNWETEKTYNVMVKKAYPKSGGSITLNEAGTFLFWVDDIIAQISALSSRAQNTNLETFDPEGQLVITFYEDIDLAQSKVSGAELDEVVYGQKCQSGYGDSCVKIDNRKQILVSFKPSRLEPGKQFQLNLDSIVADKSKNILTGVGTIKLKVYSPLVINSVLVADKNRLNAIKICSNNPLEPTEDKKAITSSPGFTFTNWSRSWSVNDRYYDPNSRGCQPNEFETIVSGDLLANTDYQMTISASDVFGQKNTKTLSFQTQSVGPDDYELNSYQDNNVVTTPNKTKLTYSARFLPQVTATVCKLSPYNYYLAKSERKVGYTKGLCQGVESKIIPLPVNQPGRNLFTIDIKDYFPEAIGNYALMIESPLLSKDQWRSPTLSFVSVSNLVATEKKISPLTSEDYDSLKLTGDQLAKLNNLYWIIDAATQEPVPGVMVSLYAKGTLVKAVLTNEQGIAQMTPVPGAEIAVASLGNDQVLISDSESQLSWAESAANIKKLYLYTSKPLYRPGQEVDLKGIYRLGYDGNYEIPVGQNLNLKVYDSANKVVKEMNLSPNAFGSVSATIPLDKFGALGTYRACVSYSCAYFDVLDYVPAAFQVALESGGDEFTLANQPTIKMAASYYFGVPVSNAGVDYRLSSQYYYFDKYTKEYFHFNNLYQDSNNYSYYYGDRYLRSGQTTLDDNGKADLRPEIEAADLTDPGVSKIIILDTTTKNQQGRSIGAQKSFVLHVAPNYLGSKIDNSFVAKGQVVTAKLKTVKSDGTPIGLGGLKAELYRVSWTGTAASYNNRYLSWKRERQLVKTIDAQTDSNGDGTITFIPDKEGEYELDLMAKGSGVAVGSRSWLYVYGGDHVNVRYDNDTSLELILDKDNFKPRETGEVLIKMPEGKGKALVTVERGKIFSYQAIDITGNMTRFQFPITEEYYPNVYVSVVAYPPGKAARFGNESLAVESNRQSINLSVSTDKNTFTPGDTVTLRLKATDNTGQPVKAEVSLAIVDMSVLALRGNPKKEPLSFFYGYIPLTVKTYSNYRNLLKEVVPANAADGKGGSGSDPSKQKSRGIFKEVAYWNPGVLTNDQGLVNVTFTLPDNLTTWQTEALAISTDTKMGIAYKELTTNKPLMVSPLKPRFILPGDNFSLGATIFNHSNQEVSGTVSLAVAELGLDAAKSNQSLSLAPGKSKTLYWALQVPTNYRGSQINYTLNAQGSGLSDIVEDKLTVNQNNTYEVTATAGQTDTSATELVYVPPTVLSDRGELTINSSATLAIFLTDILEKIAEYPYDCTEQLSSQIKTLALIKRSRAIPNLDPAGKEIKIRYQDNDYTVDELIDLGLAKIYSRQNSDGGLKLWPDSNLSSISGTAEAIKTFAVLNQLGLKVDTKAWDKAASFLFDQYLRPRDRALAECPCFVIPMSEALFTKPEYRVNPTLVRDFNDAVNKLLRDRKSASLNLLLTADQLMHRYGISSDLARQVDTVIMNRLVIDSRGAFLDSSGVGGYYDDTAISNTARYISLLSQKKETNLELPNLLRWLVTSRDKDGIWGSTQNTLLAVTALTDYLDWQNETSANFTLENSLNGKVVNQLEVGPKTVLNRLTTKVPIDQLLFGKINTVNLAKSAATRNNPGRIYYDMSFKYYLEPTSVPPRDEGFAIKRDFFALTDKENEKPLHQAKVGEVVREHLEITVPVSRYNVAIEDFIPAGAEIVDTSLATEDKLIQNIEKEVRNPVLWPNHTEWRDDRAFMFIDSFQPGTYEFDYLVRALSPGKYQQLPAQISEMYLPENFGRTGTSIFTIEQ